MDDLSTAFILLDIIQGHPGYTVKCYQCEEPITDIFGHSLTGFGWQQTSWEPGPRHYDPLYGETCPIYWARREYQRQLAEQRAEDQIQVAEENFVKLRVAMSQAKASPRGPYFPAESPE